MMIEKVIKIRNLDCAACAAELQEELEKIAGVKEASVDFVTQRVSLAVEGEETLEKCRYAISHFEEVEIVEDEKRVIKIRNLDCAACAAELQEELAGIAGVSEASVDFVTQRVALVCTDEALAKCRYAISHFEEVEIVEGGASIKKERHLKEVISIAISVLLFIPALVLQIVGGVSEWWSFGLFLGSFAAAGWSVVLSVGKNLLKAFKGNFGVLLDENTLMLIAAVGAFAIGENMEGAAVMVLYQIGEYLQSRAVGSSRGAITRLMELKSETAIRLDGETQTEVVPEELAVGDIILIRKGDKVPVD
ncbi:MAG: heavy metal translocating P-type ATPase, partial [Clostridiales bacterium]|nr:heavy metal translocating P-type ATPase [Clostridiales bacterium]